MKLAQTFCGPSVESVQHGQHHAVKCLPVSFIRTHRDTDRDKDMERNIKINHFGQESHITSYHIISRQIDYLAVSAKSTARTRYKVQNRLKHKNKK